MSCFWGHFSILLHGQINTSEVDEGESHNTVKWKVKTCLNLSVWIPFLHLNAMREPLWQETDYILTNFWLTFDSLTHSLAKQTSIPIHLAFLSLSFHSYLYSSLLSSLVTHTVLLQRYPDASKSPALISSSKRVTHMRSASLITAWNHSGLTGREIKTAMSFTQL